MINPIDKNVAYILISPEKSFNLPLENQVACERLCSVLYSKGYTILPVQGYYKNKYEKSFLAFTDDSNDDLRFDAIFLMDMFEQDTVIVKYRGDEFANKIFKDGSEKNLSLSTYDSEAKDKTFLHNGLSFTFTESKKYFFPKKKEELKSGMVVEFFNNNKWTTKQIGNLDVEFERMYKLLIKYEKLRVECI